MEIEQTTRDGIPVLVVAGRVQLTDADDFENAIRSLEEKSSQFIIDLSRATYICSMGLGALIASRRRLMRKGGEIRIVADSGDVLDVIRLTMIDKVILIENSIESAISSFLNRLKNFQNKSDTTDS